MTDSYDVLTQGSPFFDMTFAFTDRDELPELGHEVYASGFAVNPGGIFNISATLSQLGFRVGVKGLVGNDIFSSFILDRMQEAGLSLDLLCRVEEPLPLLTVGISFPHDRVFISHAAPRRQVLPHPRITAEDLDRYRPRAIFTYGELDLDLCRAARRRGILTLVDGYWSPGHLHSSDLHERLAEIDIFAPNLPEAREMTGAETAEEALGILSQWCRCVVIKAGPQGCVACREGEQYNAPAIPVQAVDTTGAGDNFNAGLIYGLLNGYSFAQSLRCANIAGGLSTLVLGGCGNCITAAEIEQRLGQPEGAMERS